MQESLLSQALVLSMREQNSGKKSPKLKLFSLPRRRGLKYSLPLNLLSGLPSREAALALIFQSGLEGSTSDLQRLRNGRRRDCLKHRQKPEHARREIAMYQRPFERR